MPGTPRPTPAIAELLRAAGTMAGKSYFRRLLYITDLPLPESLTSLRGAGRKKLVRVVTDGSKKSSRDADVATITIPTYDLSRPEKLRLALLGGLAHDLLSVGNLALALVAQQPRRWPDALMVTQVGAGLGEEALTHGTNLELGRPEVVEAVLQLAVAVGAEGWEGHPVGALFVLGDAAAVMQHSRQLGLNPFYGYSERERNLLDPAVREAVRAFATLDGAIIIRDDGVVMAAGRYLEIHEGVSVPLGLGARHMAAAGITAATGSTSFAVSQTSGVVRVFRGGKQSLQFNPARRRI